MKCPNCGGKMRVVESFPHFEKSLVYRTRECYDCKDRYATQEVITTDTVIPKAVRLRKKRDKADD